MTGTTLPRRLITPSIEWGARMAAGVMVIVPSMVFFLLVNRHIVRGLSAGAVKG